MKNPWIKLAGILVTGVLVTGVAATTLAQTPAATTLAQTPTATTLAQTPTVPIQGQSQAQPKETRRLRRELKALHKEQKQGRALHRELRDDIRELHRLIGLAQDAQQTDGLKQAVAAVGTLRDDLRLLRESQMQIRSEWMALRQLKESQQFDQAAAQAARVRQLLHQRNAQLKGAHTRAGKLIANLKHDLRSAGVNP